ncbi:neuropeptide FF receptor 2-like [Montipora capricornis]|uniref:neuropeptide FF receptor 2-like n=1 Tax=Montipora capricornis TaxID=246305 RepID=UPI0035F10433
MDVKEAHSRVEKFNSKPLKYYKTVHNISRVFLALGTVENILLCLILYKAFKMRAPHSVIKLSSFFLLQLAITDLVFRAVHVFPLVLVRDGIELGTVLCKIVIFSSSTCAAVTFISLAGIAADRYIHIIFPIRTFGIKPKKHLIMVFIWIYAMAICSGFIFSATVSKELPPHKRRPLTNACPNSTCYNTHHPMDDKKPAQHCGTGISSDSARKISFTIYFSLAFLLPLFVIVFSYTKIIISLRRKTKDVDLGNRSTARAQLRTIKIFVIVVFSFLFSWAPIMTLDMIESYTKKERFISIGVFSVRPLFDCITQTSSLFNPLIYSFGDANFRKSLRSLFRVVEKQRGVNINTVSPTAEGKKRAPYRIQMTERNPRVCKSSLDEGHR